MSPTKIVTENKWDAAEVFIDSDNSGTYTSGEDFTDRGNNLYDEEEEFTLKDANADGVEDTLLYVIGDKPDNLIVDWSDPMAPEVRLEIIWVMI
ncbi:hypothetical protein Ct9H90mP12_2520 [bacterium]|nr:MAG: hypothetical protein Ct9H90mP12_2520 [bacterium]